MISEEYGYLLRSDCARGPIAILSFFIETLSFLVYMFLKGISLDLFLKKIKITSFIAGWKSKTAKKESRHFKSLIKWSIVILSKKSKKGIE